MAGFRQCGDSWERRQFLATVAGATNCTLWGERATADDGPAPSPLANAIFLGDQFVRWQAPYGGPDP